MHDQERSRLWAQGQVKPDHEELPNFRSIKRLTEAGEGTVKWDAMVTDANR